jgi:hypothetical protein
MPERVRITSRKDENEGLDAKVDEYGNLAVREGFITQDNQTYEDSSFAVGDSPAVHDFYTDTGRYANDGYIICDGVGDIQVDVSIEGLTYGDKFTLKSGEKMSFLRMKISKIRITHTGTDSAYRINLI